MRGVRGKVTLANQEKKKKKKKCSWLAKVTILLTPFTHTLNFYKMLVDRYMRASQLVLNVTYFKKSAHIPKKPSHQIFMNYFLGLVRANDSDCYIHI